MLVAAYIVMETSEDGELEYKLRHGYAAPIEPCTLHRALCVCALTVTASRPPSLAASTRLS